MFVWVCADWVGCDVLVPCCYLQTGDVYAAPCRGSGRGWPGSSAAFPSPRAKLSRASLSHKHARTHGRTLKLLGSDCSGWGERGAERGAWGEAQ